MMSSKRMVPMVDFYWYWWTGSVGTKCCIPTSMDLTRSSGQVFVRIICNPSFRLTPSWTTMQLLQVTLDLSCRQFSSMSASEFFKWQLTVQTETYIQTTLFQIKWYKRNNQSDKYDTIDIFQLIKKMCFVIQISVSCWNSTFGCKNTNDTFSI